MIDLLRFVLLAKSRGPSLLPWPEAVLVDGEITAQEKVMARMQNLSIDLIPLTLSEGANSETVSATLNNFSINLSLNT